MQQSINVLIIDDEPQSRLLVKKLLSDFTGSLFAVHEAGNIAEAIEKTGTIYPDLVFLDIQMRGETGFDLLNKLSNWNFGIIFITAHSEFAIKAFRYSALDYLLKPIDKTEFNEALERALPQIIRKKNDLFLQIDFLKTQLKNNGQAPDKLSISTSEGIIFIDIQSILYCHALNNYTEFRLTDRQKIISSHTLGYYNELLVNHNFFRIHRSYLVNLSHIQMYKRGDGGSVIMKDGEEIEVSRNNKEAFLKTLKI